MKISFCLITLNEADNLARCLRSLADLADEIVVVDSGSKDETEKIARSFGVRWQHQDWLGYVGQKNLALSLATHPWVFSIDADEELSPALREEIRVLKSASVPPVASGFSLPRCVFFEGRWIRHGDWYPDRLVRLFRRDQAKFAGGKVHERLEVSGPIEPLRGDLHHYSFRDAADLLARYQQYSRLWVETQVEQGRRGNALAPYTHGLATWLRFYLFKRGFLDGKQGWTIATTCARGVFAKYALLHEKTRGG